MYHQIIFLSSEYTCYNVYKICYRCLSRYHSLPWSSFKRNIIFDYESRQYIWLQKRNNYVKTTNVFNSLYGNTKTISKKKTKKKLNPFLPFENTLFGKIKSIFLKIWFNCVFRCHCGEVLKNHIPYEFNESNQHGKRKVPTYRYENLISSGMFQDFNISLYYKIMTH